ncbi:hypothetical protein Droror1_Dr00010996 [Drosera rotundifolia]
MQTALRLRTPPRPLHCVTTTTTNLAATRRQPSAAGVLPQQQPRRFTAASIQLTATNEAAVEAEVADSCQSRMTETTPIPIQWSFCQRDLIVLNFAAFAVAASAIWLFCVAIPTLRAIKRAAESLEKLLDVTREELPDTMAAIRLSGMEISDLTMELSDLGQEITQGVRSSTRAVRVAEERIRDLTNINQAAPVQDIEIKKIGTEPVVARTARIMRDGVVKGRRLLRMLFTISQLSRFVVKYFVSRAKKKP